MTTTIYSPDVPHLTIEIDYEKLMSTERCTRCGMSKVFDGVQTLLNALDGGSSFQRQHRLPNCGINGLKDLMEDMNNDKRS